MPVFFLFSMYFFILPHSMPAARTFKISSFIQTLTLSFIPRHLPFYYLSIFPSQLIIVPLSVTLSSHHLPSALNHPLSSPRPLSLPPRRTGKPRGTWILLGVCLEVISGNDQNTPSLYLSTLTWGILVLPTCASIISPGPSSSSSSLISVMKEKENDSQRLPLLCRITPPDSVTLTCPLRIPS